MTRNQTHDRTRRQGKRTRRPRTISISLDERAQTTQDFAVGIGIFLLAIAFVFTFLPSVITPFDSSIGGAETAQADRVADLIVQNTSINGNNISESGFQAYTDDNLTAELGLRNANGNTIDQVNVSVEYLGNDTVVGPPSNWTGGAEYDDQSAASAARIITTDGSRCEPACRLVVRVW
ncbi:hypothetical protein [Natrinema sp. 1APR25-10V2]|uniref:DUF7287 family protein n=1 Tax=Natrinema sp. 1APR25-10V2 TaxID=2951081 RepID=UPI0028768D18|nr:hypothetical protein [Natrinema sp. 1APR25-10V2]MDS0474136.1 hypothetical protein [Natrinema sp. 1APR25-10V2]